MIDLESRFFERAHPDTEKMVDYGFRKTAEGYRYSVDILDQEFLVDLLVSFSGELQGNNSVWREYHSCSERL